MIRRIIVPLAAVAVLVALAVPALGQGTGFTVESVDTGDYPEVAVTVTVESQLLQDAEPSFRIIEEGSERDVTVAAATSDDLQVVLLLDVSGSMAGEPLSGAKAAARQFVETMPAGVEMAIIAFGNSPTLVSEFTEDRQTLNAAIDVLIARGETALYDGVAAAAALLGGEAETGRTVVLLSDGGDTVSAASLDEAVADLESASVELFAVELQSPENDRAALDTLAAAVGGTVLSAEEPATIEAAFADVASALLTSYRLVFTAESYDLATLNVLALVEGSVVGSRTEVIALPPRPETVVTDPVDPVAVSPDPAPAPAPLPEPRRGRFIELNWLQQGWALALGAAAIFAALAGVFVVVSLQPRGPRGGRRGTSTLTISPEAMASRRKRGALALIAESATALADQTLEGGNRLQRVNAALEKAGLALRPGEFIVLVVSAVLAAVAIGVLFAGPLIGLALGLIVILLVPTWLSSKGSQRSELFDEQLGDTLQLMSASMRAGYGLMQAIDAVAEEAPAPTSEEFGRIKVETHLGRDLSDALQATATRVDSEDFRWVAEAIEIHRQIGGDLAEILDAVNETIRDRNRIRRRIKALSAEGRISAVILSLIPIVMALFIMVANPSYIGELPDTGIGQVLIAVGILAWIVAVFWMRRIVRLIF